MKRLSLRAALVAIVVLIFAVGAAVPAFALEPNPGTATVEVRVTPQQAPPSDSDTLHTRALWALLGVAIACAVFGGFYLARKRAGHFDNPAWIAPISKMYSKDFPESFGDASAEPHDGHH